MLMKLVQGMNKGVYNTYVWLESLQVPIFIWFCGHNWQSGNKRAPILNLSWYSYSTWPVEPAHVFKMQKIPVIRGHD